MVGIGLKFQIFILALSTHKNVKCLPNYDEGPRIYLEDHGT